MARTHPHAEAAYSIVTLDDGSFGVEVKIPDTHPTTVSNFATRAQAEAWIVRHKNRVVADQAGQQWFRRSPGSTRPAQK